MLVSRTTLKSLVAVVCCASAAATADPLPLDYKGDAKDTGATVTANTGRLPGGPKEKALQLKVSADTVEVDLKKGKPLAVLVVATGDERAVVGLALLDKDGTVVGMSWKLTPGAGFGKGPGAQGDKDAFLNSEFGRGYGQLRRTATLKLDRVPVDGVYTIKILSDREGEYTLVASDPTQKAAPKVRSAETIRKEIEALRKQLDVLERELKEKEKGAEKIGK